MSRDGLAQRMRVALDRVVEWEETGRISIAQADRLAHRTHTPLGYLYLSKPPQDQDDLSIPDFRTRHAGAPPSAPSLDLRETVHAMERRQAWMREELIEGGAEPLRFVGAFSPGHHHGEVASAMREVLGIADGWAEGLRSWTDALGFLRARLDAAGLLVVFNGIVGNGTDRKLDPDEFQGFALADAYAPLIFVNNADFVAAETFTTAHELAHVFIGESGISRFERLQPPRNETEQFCDRAAAEFLVPESGMRDAWRTVERSSDPYQVIARHIKVSAIVAARRALDLNLIDREEYFDFYEKNKYQGKANQSTGAGGDFWKTQRWRIGPRFAATVVRAEAEGRVTYREACSLTGLSGDTFDNMAVELDITL